MQLDSLYKKKVIDLYTSEDILILISYNYTRKIRLRNVTLAQQNKRNITNEKSHALLFSLIMYLFKS